MKINYDSKNPLVFDFDWEMDEVEEVKRCLAPLGLFVMHARQVVKEKKEEESLKYDNDAFMFTCISHMFFRLQTFQRCTSEESHTNYKVLDLSIRLNPVTNAQKCGGSSEKEDKRSERGHSCFTHIATCSPMTYTRPHLTCDNRFPSN